ncbi:MAG: sialate O-acetylesterase [Verrucomicrobia bacterium]|nr:sialate O-acetylesterase [Verrucomicrobiota bacterium]
MKKLLHSALLVSLLAFATAARADVKLPAIISDHMVLQQKEDCAIWGWADPGEAVTVTIAGKSKSTKAGKDGKWMVELPELKPGGPLTLVVKGKNTITVNDVLVGEVWLGSGQSNMGMRVSSAQDFEGEKAKANHPNLRMFTVGANAIPTPQADCKGSWVICSAETVGNFSAALYFHGRELHAKLGVPMGLINSSWGGTAIEAWISAEAQSGSKFARVQEPWAKQLSEPWDEKKLMTAYDKQVAAYKIAAATAKAEKKTAPRAPRKPVDPRLSQNRPANLFNGMIAPIIPYTLRGAVWYQGEHNAGSGFPDLYSAQLESLIKDWRKRWDKDFAFAWVQLPDFKAPQTEPVENTGWVTVREQMLKTLSVKKTGMAITLGLGMAGNIHPINKQEVGRRLALWALDDVYEREEFPSSGPLPKSHKIRGGEVTITFKHTDGGLKAHGGELKGFAIAGADKKFIWANAKIEGDKVIVSSPDVPKPASVRYAWADNPVWSLENGAGLPATPFRTDDWK